MDIESVLKMVAALNSHIQNSLVKSADIGTKVRLARLVDSHVGHIVGLVNKGDVAQAKEYLEVIRPQGWEANNERNVDKLYELVVRGLSEKLDPEAFQALGL